MINKKNIIALASTSLLLLGIVAGNIYTRNKQNLRSFAATGSVDLSLTTQTQTVAPNSDFNVTVLANTNNSSLSAINLEVNFDPSLVEVSSVTPGNILTTQVKPLQVESSKATIVLAAACAGTSCSTFNGTGTLATFNLRTLGNNGQTQIFISPNTQIAVAGSNNNAIGTLSNTIITIGDPPTGAPAPSVNLTSPANGSIVDRRSQVTITADTSNNSVVTQLDFYVNNSLICTSTSAPFTCNWNVPGKPEAVYRIYATARNSANNTFLSPEITVTASR